MVYFHGKQFCQFCLPSQQQSGKNLLLQEGVIVEGNNPKVSKDVSLCKIGRKMEMNPHILDVFTAKLNSKPSEGNVVYIPITT